MKEGNAMAEDLTHTTGPVAATAAEPTGTLLSPPGYKLLDEIDHGGMGVVYRARDTALDRDVAYWDDLILWLAYKEAKDLIPFDAAPAPSQRK
jgi:hypothetical protein